MHKIDLKITNEHAGKRIDKFLYEKLQIPFSLAQKLVRTKDIRVNGAKTKSSYSLKVDDTVSVKNFIANKEQKSKEQNNSLKKKLLEQLEVIFRDGNILAINKPYDIPVQGGNKIKISIDDVLDELKFEYEERPKLVHRLDRHTSGLLLIARTKRIAQELMLIFQTKSIQKTYIALVVGKPQKKYGTLKMKIKKNLVGDIEKMAEAEDGKESITEYNVLKYFPNNLCLIEFRPITGKMHQIRIHAAEILGCPIVGDKKYGGIKAVDMNLEERSKLHLAAVKITIENLAGNKYQIECPLPTHMKKSAAYLKSLL